MRTSLAVFAIAVAAVAASRSPAHAIPPTVTPSPGYDARLAEQRRALHQPPVIAVKPKPRRAWKRHRID